MYLLPTHFLLMNPLKKSDSQPSMPIVSIQIQWILRVLPEFHPIQACWFHLFTRQIRP